MKRHKRTRGGQAGVALLMVVTTVAILAIVIVEFASNARTHLNEGVNLRDQARASTLADTSLVMARACLDNEAWGPFASIRSKLDLEKLCNLMLGIFVRGRVDLPVGGLSVELDDIKGVGISAGEIEDIKLTPEEGFVGLAGLHCPPGSVGSCPEQRAAVQALRSILNDPKICHWFESERADGQRYTRDDIIANLIDWVDPDDQRTAFDPNTGQIIPGGASEGEDAYYSRQDDRYRSKDEPFDSVEELRLVRGVDDEMYDFIKDKVSVHSSGKVNVNTANVQVLASLLRASSSTAQLPPTQNLPCGSEVVGPGGVGIEPYYLAMAQLLVEVRQFRQLTLNTLLAQPFKSARDFRQCAEQVTTCWYNALSGSFLGFQTQGMNPQQVVQQKIFTLLGLPNVTGDLFDGFAKLPASPNGGTGGAGIDFRALERQVRVDSKLFRLEASGRVGNMTRKVFAILKQEPKYVRTLYYREE